MSRIIMTGWAQKVLPHENDVLLGRGGNNNKHSGNEMLRELARQNCEKYRVATKKRKSEISRQLVRQMRHFDPAARFLKKNPVTGEWEDAGDDIAREKASQVLRDAVVTAPLREPPREVGPTKTEEQVTRATRASADMPDLANSFSESSEHYEDTSSCLPPPSPIVSSHKRLCISPSSAFSSPLRIDAVPSRSKRELAVPESSNCGLFVTGSAYAVSPQHAEVSWPSGVAPENVHEFELFQCSHLENEFGANCWKKDGSK